MASTLCQRSFSVGRADTSLGHSMYGKYFASAFTGSMFGAGPVVFAVWSYVIANTDQEHNVELNPLLLAACLGTTPDEVAKAIDYLTGPDHRSRSPENSGARMVRIGAFSYFVVNHGKYRAIRNEDERRAYNRDAQRKHRCQTASNGQSLTVNDNPGQSMTVIEMSAVSAHAEAEDRGQRTEAIKTKDTSPKTVKIADDDLFDSFWSDYGKKVGKAETIKVWNKMTTEDRQAAADGADAYVELHPDGQYRKDPVRYLKGRHWEDEEPQTLGQEPAARGLNPSEESKRFGWEVELSVSPENAKRCPYRDIVEAAGLEFTYGTDKPQS